MKRTKKRITGAKNSQISNIAGLSFRISLQAFGTEAVVIPVHNDDHLTFMYLCLFAPAILVGLTIEHLSARRTYFFAHVLSGKGYTYGFHLSANGRIHLADGNGDPVDACQFKVDSIKNAPCDILEQF